MLKSPGWRRSAIRADRHSMGQCVSPIMCLRHRVGISRITSNRASVRVTGSLETVANSLWVANSNKNTGVATSHVLHATIALKPCCIGTSFNWPRLPRKNRQNVVLNKDLVVVCVVLLLAWPLYTPTRTMCPPLLFFLHLLWMVSTSMTKNLRYMYSLTWRPCRTRNVMFWILLWPKPGMTSVQSASRETCACATSWSGWTHWWRRTAKMSRCCPTTSKGMMVILSLKSNIDNAAWVI